MTAPLLALKIIRMIRQFIFWISFAFTPLAVAVSAAESAVPISVIFFGDSLTAGLGLAEGQAFPSLVEALLRERATVIKQINAGVSGDTTAGGVSRLAWSLKAHPDFVIVELGANDMLRGIATSETKTNLQTIVSKIKAAGAKPILLGMKATANLGRAYRKSFDAIFPAIAKQEQIPLLPFILEGVATIAKLNQPDGLHPNFEGEKIVAARVANFLFPLLKK